MEITEVRIPSCAHCGGDKPWARRDWYYDGTLLFCSRYCAENYQSFLRRMARKGKLRPAA